MKRLRKYILDEAEHSDIDEEPEDDNEQPNAEDLDFIDDTNHYVPSAPPPLFETERLEFYDEDLDHALVPYVPPIVPPTPNQPPPPPPPPQEPADDWIEPKRNANKRLTQIIEAHLPGAYRTGGLTFNLVTIIPDIDRTLEQCWIHAEMERALIVEQVMLLPGLFGAIVALETHGGTRPKATDDKKAKKKGKKQDIILDIPEPADEEEVQGQKKAPTKRGKLSGKPHFHVLLYYPDTSYPVLDLSAFKRRLMFILPKSDVNQKKLPENPRCPDPDFIRVTCYVLKGFECKATASHWAKHCPAGTKPPLAEFYHGPQFAYDPNTQSASTEAARRFVAMLDALQEWCKCSLPYATGSAPAFFKDAAKRCQQHKAMIQFAQILSHHGILVGGSLSDRYYEKEQRLDYPVLSTYIEAYDFFGLVRHLSQSSQATDLLLKWKEKIPYWVRFDLFPHLPKLTYEWVELKDAFYSIRTGIYHMKNDPRPFGNICFRSYSYTAHELAITQPVEWINMVDYMCSKELLCTVPDDAHPGQFRSVFSEEVDKNALLRDMALLLRKRYPKQPVPFLWGESNSGKTTLISFIPSLYPNAARGFLNSSVASLSGIHEDIVILYCDEFKVDLITREDLLILLDGAQPLTVRKYHQDARMIDNPLMPIVLADNFKPKYYNDDSKALENRLVFYHFTKPLVRDNAVAEKIRRDHLLVVRYLNDFLIQQAAKN